MADILQKFIASSGLCSRRKAEELIRKGQVFINGKRAELGMRAGEDDEVKVEGRKIKNKKDKIYIKMNKPAGYVCTNKSFSNEKNVFDLLKDLKKRLFIVGRLDKGTRGLVLLTNDGDITQRITHPRYGHEKEYVLKADGIYERFDINKFLKACKKGFEAQEIGKVNMKNIEYLGDGRFKAVLVQGKKRQIRKMFEEFGLKVNELKRIRINKLRLGDLPEGRWEYLTKKEINDLM